MMDHILNTKFVNIMEPFNTIIEPLKYNGWQIIMSDSTKIVMNKKYYELEEINIEYKNSFYHFSLPINNSTFSFYKKITDESQSIEFLKIYVNGLT